MIRIFRSAVKLRVYSVLLVLTLVSSAALAGSKAVTGGGTLTWTDMYPQKNCWVGGQYNYNDHVYGGDFNDGLWTYTDVQGHRTNYTYWMTYSGSPGGPSCPAPGWSGTPGFTMNVGAAGTVTVQSIPNVDNITAVLTPPPPPTITDHLNPKYKIVGVVYAPPGGPSFVEYTNTTMMGTSTSVQNSFSTQMGASIKMCEGGGIFDITQVKVCETYSNSFTQEEDTSSSFAIDQTQSFLNHWPGSLDGLNHGNDVIYVWLNPVVWFTIPDQDPPAPSAVQWNGYSYDPADDYNNGGDMEVVPIHVSECLGGMANLQLTNTYLYNRLQRTWALLNTDGTSPAITDTDLQAICKADPFSDPSYVFSVPPGTRTSADSRFTKTINSPLIYEPGTATQNPPTFNYSWDYAETQTQGKGAKYTHQESFAVEESVAVHFWIGLSFDLTNSYTWTWTDQWNTLITQKMGQRNTVSITGPSYCAPGSPSCTPYTGPEQFDIYQDNIYGTFMMYPILSSFTLSAFPTSQTVNPGASTTYSLSTETNYGYTGTLTLIMQPGLPSGATVSFGANPISAGSSTTLTVNTTPSTPPGTYPLAVEATDGTLIYFAYFTLVVATPDFSVAVAPPSQTVTAGNCTTFTAATTAINGFIGNVMLSTGTLPQGVSAVFNPNPVAAGSSSIMTLCTTASTPVGSYSFDVYGTSGTKQHSADPRPTLNVNPGGPVVSLSAVLLTFPTIVVGQTSSGKAVTLTNTGAGTLHISGVTVSGDFLISANNCGSQVAAGANCKVTVKFRPTAKDTRTGTLSFTDDAPGSPQTVSLSGVGTQVVVSPTSLAFGTVTVGTTSASQAVTIQNAGTTPVNFTSFTFTGKPNDYKITSNSCGSSLAGGASCTVNVAFKPIATGARNGKLVIAHDGGDSPHNVTLTGTGG